MPRTITLGAVHLTHQPRPFLGALIRRGLVIEFTSTLLKPAGDPKPDGCRRGCDFSPAGVATDGFGWVPQVWPWAGFCQTCLVAIPTYRPEEHIAPRVTSVQIIENWRDLSKLV
jgi:hypothetical protein